ncbi:unnamed protein product [Coregonus sp. 'balchen']|nr:unnamed protein product [Coregonus sp. 'balchen']
MFCWGDCSSGQFGLHFENVSVPIAGNIFSDKVTEIACGEQHTLFLTVDGRILSCGRNSKGQLGRQKNRDSKLPAPVEGLARVVSVACGQDHCVAVCASGQVYSWGAGGEGQLGIAPTTVSKTSSNTFALANNSDTGGQVFSWGLNSHGQLGLGKGVPLQPIPALVRSLTGVPVTQVAAGGTHTLALTLPGLVYCCGANRAGQLGLNRVDEKGRYNICAVPALRVLGVSFISCGEAHSAVLTKDGRVFTFGEGSRGQLGHDASANELIPKLVERLDGLVSQIACGSHHTLVLGSSGQLWAFGSGVKGQLGTGNTEGSLRPTSVLLKRASGGAATVIHNDMKISVGWNSNFIYTAESSEREQPIGRLDEAKLQKWLTMEQGNAEAQRNILDVLNKFKSCGQFHQSQVNILPLVDTLRVSAAVIKSPEIFMILPTIPLLHDDQNVMNMVMALAILIVEDLSETAMKTLKEWWSSMETNIMTKHILMWKNALSFMLRNGLLVTHNPGVKFLLEALKYLHRANKRAGRIQKVPASAFYVEEIIGSVIAVEDLKLWHFWSTRKDTEETPVIFCRYPFVLNLICKMGVFNIHAHFTKESHKLAHRLTVMCPPGTFTDDPESPPAPVFQLKLRRPSLIEDTFRQLGAADHDYFHRELVLTAVNKRDFFLHLFDELLAPESEMFMYNDTKTLVWFPAKPRVEEKSYFLFGVLCGMALYNHNIVHLPFPLALFKKMVGVKPSLEDLREFDPVVGGSLRYLLEEYTDDDVEENLDMTSTQFVDAYVNLAFNQSVEKVFEEFRRGFFKVCDRDVVEFFQPEELRGVMVGKEDYDWDTLKQNTVYDGEYHARHPNIVTFWEAFEELTDDQKKAFLLFLTGCDRAPILGMDNIQMKIAVLQNSTELHFPESLTCYFLLLLPIYPSKEMLLARLKEAVAHNRGFWKEIPVDGFGLVKSNGLVKTNTDSCVNFIGMKSPITHLSAGNTVVAFIRKNGEQVSVARMQEDKDGRRITGKLKGNVFCLTQSSNVPRWVLDRNYTSLGLGLVTFELLLSSLVIDRIVMVTFGCLFLLCFLRRVGNLNQNVECREKMVALSCGDAHVVLLSEEGRVFCLAQFSNVPRRVDGNVFTWGQNSSGQLGLGKGKPITLSLQPVKSLSGIPLAQITAGGDHSFALSLSGAVFGWGKNNAGQLGLGDTIDRPAPAPVDCLNLKKTIAVSCGVEHTAVLTKGGIVFTFGSGRYGQLGHNSFRDELRPRLVGELWGAKVTQIACGRNHTLAFVGSFKKIYSFGLGEQGQLGNGVKMDQSVPLPTALMTSKLNKPLLEETILLPCAALLREITKTFSSASRLNGSFLDKSRDKHYQTSLKHSGLDLSLARLVFQKLAEKDKVLAEVKEVVQHILLPSLSKDPIGVEGLRVYLIIPELLRVLLKQQRGIDITEAFAAAILRLNPDKLQILDTFFKTLVKTFHSASAEGYAMLNTFGDIDYLNLSEGFFDSFHQQSCIFNTEAKCIVYQLELRYRFPFHGHFWVPILHVSRETALEDAFQHILQSGHDFTMPLKVKFQAEHGVDEGGVSLEFFSLLGREILTMEPKTLEVYEDSGLVWFTTDDSGITDEFYLLGLLCGMALYNQCVLNLCFPLALFKKLLDEEVVEALDLVFMDKGQELIPNGEEVPVTMVNRKKYVDLYVDMKLNKSVQNQFADFEKGFHKGCPIQAWRMFLPEELMTLLQGDDNYEWDKLRENAKYQGYRPTDDIIQNFWIVFMEFSEEQKKKFLTFLTGTDRLPRGRSLSKLQMQITSLGGTDADEYYPKAQTCYVTLCLPNYSSIDILQDKLLHAITHCDACDLHQGEKAGPPSSLKLSSFFPSCLSHTPSHHRSLPLLPSISLSLSFRPSHSKP